MTAVVTRAHTRGTAWNSKATDSEFFIATNCNLRPTLATDAAAFAWIEAVRLILDG
jgi:hypothetical protein